MAQNSKDAQKRTSRAERRAAEAAAMKARAEQMEKERKQQTIIGGIVVAVLVILVAIGLKDSEVGVAGKMPSIGAKKGPISVTTGE